MSPDPHQAEFDRLYNEINELRQCKTELASLKEFKLNSENRFNEIKENIEKLFNKIEGNGRKGLKDEIAEIKELLGKFDENITEVYDRIEKIEALLEKTIKEVYELTPIVKALMNVESERRTEKASFRRELRMWIIGFIGTVVLTAAGNWIAIKDNAAKQPKPEEIKAIVVKTITQNNIRDSLLLEIKRLDSTANSK